MRTMRAALWILLAVGAVACRHKGDPTIAPDPNMPVLVWVLGEKRVAPGRDLHAAAASRVEEIE